MATRTEGHSQQVSSAADFVPGNRVRRAQSEFQFADLDRRLREWVEHRTSRDELHQHGTQLETIRSMVGVGSEGVATELVQLPLEQDPLFLYEACRTYDLRAVWIERVWEFFRSKLDQRDGGDYRRLLMAADQVVWSCYRPPIERAGIDAAEQGARVSVVPLPFVESRYALEAFPATTVPADLAEDAGVVSEYLERLPMGLVRIPPGCARAPWMLVLVAHEVGHTLQDELAPGLTDEFADAIAAAVGDAGDANWWRRWSREIFADVVSVLLAGPWALRALIELEKRAPQQMLDRRGRYPPAVIRLKLLERAAAAVGLDAAWVLELLPAGASPDDTAVAGDRRNVDAVVEAALASLPSVGASLRELCDVRPAEFEIDGDVDRWAGALADEEASVPTGSGPRAARLMACAALAAWDALPAGATTEERREAEGKLAKRALAAIAGSRDGAFRADGPAPGAAKRTGQDLAAALLRANADDLLAEAEA